jgi:methionyl-tRNA synthetase
MGETALGEHHRGGQPSREYRDVVVEKIVQSADAIARCFDRREFSLAMRLVMGLADDVNAWWDEAKPWVLAKNFAAPLSPGDPAHFHRVCSAALECFRLLTIYLKPVCPALAAEAEGFLRIQPLSWEDIGKPLRKGHIVGVYSHLVTRIDPKQVEALIAPPAPAAPPPPKTSTVVPKAEAAPATGTISIDDFAKVDLRIARIVAAEHVEGADKLLKLSLDIGDGRPRTVFAGIKSAYDPAMLVGRLTPMVANLAPRKMKFGLSEGMVLAASGEGPGLFLLAPDDGAVPGMKVK